MPIPMPIDPQTTEALAGDIVQARALRQVVRQCSKRYPDMTVHEAYAVQHAVIAQELARGRSVKGRKIGLTSRATQLSFQAQEPTHALLLDDMLVDDGSALPAQRFISPRVEAELAFVLGKPLRGPGLGFWDVLQAVAWAMPALEIIDARMHLVDPETRGARTVVDQIADYGTCAGMVTGASAVDPRGLDFKRVGAIVRRDGVVEETGLCLGVMNHPLLAVAWLANHLGAQGQGLAAGELILAGAFTRPVPMAPGQTVQVDFGLLGTLSVHLTADAQP